jgi:phosphoglycerol transferase MdoB-like AlkP superfamily enzyme
MVMTTSNHRPYTYPAGKIDIPSATGRGGGVKYADYAVGQLMA